MRVAATSSRARLSVTALALAGLLAGQACGVQNEQRIEYQGLTISVPGEWRIHELDYYQVPLGGNREVHDEWLLLQTNPEEECDLDRGHGATPGEDYGCSYVMLLGPASIKVGHGLSDVDENNPFAFGTNPVPCAEGLQTDLEEPEEPEAPADLKAAEDVRVGEESVPYREWALACLGGEEPGDFVYHLQRTWYLPDMLIVDNWSTEGLGEYVADAELDT